MTCLVCRHAQRHQIDQQLIAGDTFRHIALQHGLSTGALQRHKRSHLGARLAAAKKRAEQRQDTAVASFVEHEVEQDSSLLQQTNDLRRRALQILETAEHGGKLETCLRAIREVARLLQLTATMGEITAAADRENPVVISADEASQKMARYIAAMDTLRRLEAAHAQGKLIEAAPVSEDKTEVAETEDERRAKQLKLPASE